MSGTPKRPFEIRLDPHSGVPVYRQIIDLVLGGVASRTLRPGDQLPTVRQLAVDLAVNPNTVIRAYRELEIRGVLDTQQGTGTFVSAQEVRQDSAERQRRLAQITADFVARAGAEGYSLKELLHELEEMLPEQKRSK